MRGYNPCDFDPMQSERRELARQESGPAFPALQKSAQEDDATEEVRSLIDSAYINAHETVHVEKAIPAVDEDAFALRSLESLLCETDVSAETQAWFVAHGVRW